MIAVRFGASFPAEGAELLEAEAEALSRLVAEAARGAYQVRDPATGALRPSRAGDVMVLARRYTQLRHLEDALEAFYGLRGVRGLPGMGLADEHAQEQGAARGCNPGRLGIVWPEIRRNHDDGLDVGHRRVLQHRHGQSCTR